MVAIWKQQRRVLVFGVFDPIHKGHEYFFRQAKNQGDYLLVVVARDSYIRAVKRREPELDEAARRSKVNSLPWVDEAVLGEEWPPADKYGLLGKLSFDVLVLGYDQTPDEATVKAELEKRGRGKVVVIRLRPFWPRLFKSSLMSPPLF